MDAKVYSERAILIDGSSFIYRAYFAIPGYLSTSKGFPTKAIFGVTQMLLKILKELDPNIIVWFMDEKGPTFRHLKYEEYKATRPSMPDDLKVQIPYIKAIVQALGIPLVSAEGYEADDLIATFIKTFDIPVLMVAPDRDLLSLISERVMVYDPVRETYLDLKGFKEKYGFEPSQFVDFRALAGDPSDNIKGVPGIGEKTAKELIKQFYNLENLYANINKVFPLKIRESLIKLKDRVFANSELMRLREDAPLPSLDLNYYTRRNPDYVTLRKLFKELEFRKFLKEFPFPEEGESIQVEVIGLKELDKILSNLQPTVLALYYPSVDSTLFGKFSKKGYLALSYEKVYEVPFEPSLWERLQNRVLFVYDYKAFLKSTDFKLEQPQDIKLMAYLINPGQKNYELNSLIVDYLDITLPKTQTKTDSKTPAFFASCILKLGHELERKLKEEDLWCWYSRVEIPLSYVLYHMEKTGVKVDLDYLTKLNRDFAEKIKAIEEELYRLAGRIFNPRSSQEVAHILFERLKLPRIKKTPKGDLPSTDAEVLEELYNAHPIVPLLLQYRSLYKLKSTYIEVFLKEVSPITGRVHTEFNQTGTATGRLSSQKPNLQNIPIKGEEGLAIRRAIIAEEGFFIVSLDYSQIELRVLAHFSGDENLLKAFQEGKDIHTHTACEVFGVTPDRVTPEMRRVAKVINFGIAYGMSPYGLSKELKIDVASAETYIKKYFARYPGVKRYMDEIIDEAKKNGWVKTICGRKRYIPELFSPSRNVRELGQRIAINTPIQGSSADLIKSAMVVLHRFLEEHNLKSRIILQVHDELLLEVPEEELDKITTSAKEIMENPFPHLNLNINFSVPIKVNVSYGKTWADCKD